MNRRSVWFLGLLAGMALAIVGGSMTGRFAGWYGNVFAIGFAVMFCGLLLISFDWMDQMKRMRTRKGENQNHRS